MPMILGVSPLSFAVLAVGAGLAAYWTRGRHKRRARTVKEKHEERFADYLVLWEFHFALLQKTP
jgi:hypothetical protein